MACLPVGHGFQLSPKAPAEPARRRLSLRPVPSVRRASVLTPPRAPHRVTVLKRGAELSVWRQEARRAAGRPHADLAAVAWGHHPAAPTFAGRSSRPEWPRAPLVSLPADAPAPGTLSVLAVRCAGPCPETGAPGRRTSYFRKTPWHPGKAQGTNTAPDLNVAQGRVSTGG